MKKTIDVQSLSVFYRDEGSGDAVVILHGWGSKSDSWQKVQEDLVKKGYRVVVPDLPGFGRSEEPKSAWALKEYSIFVQKLTGALDIKYFTLIGHSFGGRIAIDYAMRNPKHVHALVLCDTAGITRHKGAKTKIFLVLTRSGNLVFSLLPLSFLKPLLRKIWYRLGGERDYYRASPNMREIMKKVLEENLRSYLPHITKPTLILWGEEDRLTPVSDALIIHRTIPLTHLHIFPGLGHAIQLENPNGVAKQIVRFLNTYH